MTPEKQRAFTEAYAACQDRFTRYCAALAYGKMEADDLVQDVLLSTYERFEQIRQKDQLIHYLIRAARNRSVSHWRKARYQTELQEKHTRKLFANGVTPEVSLDVQLMYQKLDQLPENQRDALILFDICGFSIREIADIQHTGINTVKSYLSRGRKKLRYLMREKPVRRGWWGMLWGLFEGNNEHVFISKSYFFQTKSLMIYSLSTLTAIGAFVLVAPVNPTPKNKQVPAKAVMSQALIKPLTAGLFKVKAINHKVDTPLIQKKGHSLFTKQTKSKPRNLFDIQTIKGLAVKQPSVSQALFGTGLPTSPLLVKTKPSSSLPNDCDSLKFTGSINKFKRELLRNLRKDRLIKSKKAKNRLALKDGKMVINKKVIPYKLHRKYLKLLQKYGVQLCDQRVVQTTSKYIAIGHVTDGKCKGIFHMSGKVNINNLKDEDEDK
ncbi:RNA polymerase sigma factor [uncultured Microscilla sp.]|uniref:RNA polymerase sigma factor n=1 Tax=uncultured Microscilla sp. TaxID=432653 RepID=UPI002639CCFF|nr:RNA polymerase sigma factor [uncultured Microscilla sp.]